MSERPNLLIAATLADAADIRREFREFSSWQIMTPRNGAGSGWLYGKICWTPQAQSLPARTRWDLRQRLRPAIDDDTDEQDFPTRVLSW